MGFTMNCIAAGHYLECIWPASRRSPRSRLLDPKGHFRRRRIVIDRRCRSTAGNPDILGDVVAAIGEA